MKSVPVADILHKLLEMDGGPGQPSAILGSKHIVCWGFEDLLTSAENKEAPAPNTGSTSQPPVEKDKGSYSYSHYLLTAVHNNFTF